MKHLKLPLGLLLDSQQLVSEILLLVTHSLAQHNKLCLLSYDGLGQVGLIEVHLDGIHLVFELSSIALAGQEEGKGTFFHRINSFF